MFWVCLVGFFCLAGLFHVFSSSTSNNRKEFYTPVELNKGKDPTWITQLPALFSEGGAAWSRRRKVVIVERKKLFSLSTSNHAAFLLSLPQWNKARGIFSVFFSFGAMSRLTRHRPPRPNVLLYFLSALSPLFCQWGTHRVSASVPHLPAHLPASLNL